MTGLFRTETEVPLLWITDKYMNDLIQFLQSNVTDLSQIPQTLTATRTE